MVMIIMVSMQRMKCSLSFDAPIVEEWRPRSYALEIALMVIVRY